MADADSCLTWHHVLHLKGKFPYQREGPCNKAPPRVLWWLCHCCSMRVQARFTCQQTSDTAAAGQQRVQLWQHITTNFYTADISYKHFNPGAQYHYYALQHVMPPSIQAHCLRIYLCALWALLPRRVGAARLPLSGSIVNVISVHGVPAERALLCCSVARPGCHRLLHHQCPGHLRCGATCSQGSQRVWRVCKGACLPLAAHARLPAWQR
ncbi:hypothetical protein COO60DRAFT_1007457 [Scenedesmus sp. NREL 46B-D3]|nr:hypothetical protein COO60DRAFT_1007457 [Scenedesmus sp. NREL 46B-D3]